MSASLAGIAGFALGAVLSPALALAVVLHWGFKSRSPFR